MSVIKGKGLLIEEITLEMDHVKGSEDIVDFWFLFSYKTWVSGRNPGLNSQNNIYSCLNTDCTWRKRSNIEKK